jgi:hypothetical protein
MNNSYGLPKPQLKTGGVNSEKKGLVIKKTHSGGIWYTK